MTAPPTSPSVITGPLYYLYGVAPATHDPAFRRVLWFVERWIAGDDPPLPPTDPPPDPPPPGPKPPDPDPPPVPAYPIDARLEELQACDLATFAPAWAIVRGALAAWLTAGPFAP